MENTNCFAIMFNSNDFKKIVYKNKRKLTRGGSEKRTYEFFSTYFENYKDIWGGGLKLLTKWVATPEGFLNFHILLEI